MPNYANKQKGIGYEDFVGLFIWFCKKSDWFDVIKNLVTVRWYYQASTTFEVMHKIIDTCTIMHVIIILI